MMADYIRREDAIEAIRRSPITNMGTKLFCYDEIGDIPAANVVERKRGKWLDIRIGIGTRGRCSECKSFSWIDPFCPKCGAEMVYPAEVSWMESENDE